MLIVEGIDGVGKSTLVEYFQQLGMEKHHFDYDVQNMNLFQKYSNVLLQNNNNLILDRSFISEMVYGPVLRNSCKLTIEQYTQLLVLYKEFGAKIIYLTAPKDILLSRRVNAAKDYEVILNYYDELNNQYNNVMNYSSDYIDVLQINTHDQDINEVRNQVKRLVRK